MFNICYSILHLQTAHLYIDKCHLTLDNILLFMFDKTFPHLKLSLQCNMIFLKRSKFCIGVYKLIFQTHLIFCSCKNKNLELQK